MKKILLAIFKQNKNLRKKLLATNDKILVHSGFRIDNYWGVKKNKISNSYHGENNYGILLMQVRKYFQKKSKRRSKVKRRVRSKRKSRVKRRVRSKRKSRVKRRVRSKRRSRVKRRVRSKRRSRKPKLIKQKKKRSSRRSIRRSSRKKRKLIKQRKRRSRVRMNREKQFIKCSIKNLNIERQLAPQVFNIDAPNENTQIGIETFTRGRSGIKAQMKINLARLHILEQSGAHSLIIVKDNRLKKGWSIFEPNGKDRLPFQITDRKENVSKDYMEISPKISINIGSDAENPGYCGIFGIIFMSFYITHKDDDKWVKKWQQLLAKFNKKTKSHVTYGVALAQNVQTLVHNTPTEKQLYELIPKIAKLIN